MANVAKGSFPGCLRRKIEKKRVKNFNHRVSSHRWDDNSSTAQQLKKNLRRFCEIFGDSEDDDEFYGFSSEECGLRAYKRVSSSRETVQIPDILCSRIDLNKKKVTTRLEHARSSLDQLPSSKRTRRMKCTLVRRRYSKSKVPIVEGSDALAKPPATLQLADGESTSSDTSGFTKYKNTNLDFHRLSERASFRHSSPASSDHQSSSLKQKKSPLKPATFIAPSLAQHNKHHVTNVTPTCLKIKINPNDAAGPGHPQVLAKALLARANKRSKKPKISDRELPLHTSTPIGSFSSRSKTRLFVLPTKSSRSSRIIKANPRYLDSDADISKESIIASRPSSPAIEPLQSETKKEVKEESSAKGRPLLKEPTFRVAALASINNKPQTSRLLNKNNNINTRIRARKLIKRARFKHPTSSSTLVVGNDFDDAVDKKRNLIREATFKMPSKSQTETSAAENERSDLSDLGLSTQTWEKIVKNEINYKGEAPNWTKQEIHNLLHGAHTFANSWTRVARHYEYHPLHKDWQSVKAKLNSLQSYGLLSGNLKVKSSVLLQLKHRYSETPNVTVFSQRELRMRGMENNVECDVGEGGRLKSRTDESDKVEEESPDLRDQDPIALKQRHIQLYREWSESKSSEPPSSSSVYLGLGKKAFMSMCVSPRSTSKKISWSVREIHNILHGIHIFGVSEWSIIHTNYVFQKAHDNVEIRMKFRSIKSKSLVSSGKVKDEVLPLLQPLLSPAGKKYFGLSSRKGRINSPKPKKRQPLTEVSKKNQKISTKKRLSSADADLSSPPRKQAYHLFGTAPVWDDSGSASGLQSLGDTQSDAEEDDDFVQQKSSGKSRRRSSKDGGRSRKDSIGSSISRKNRSHSEDGGTVVATRGPRIKHVCRRASLVTGHKLAVYSDDGSDLHLSALPKKERQKIAAEVEKLRRVPSDSTISSDSEDEVVNSNISKQMTKKKERSLRTIKKKSDRVANKTRCNSCKNCKIPECGDCDHCRGRSPANSCPERPQCLNPPSSIATKESNKKSTGSEKRSSTPLPQEEKRKTCSPRLQEQQPVLRKNSASSGIILSPDSRRQLQQELQEQARKLPSIVKIDQWKVNFRCFYFTFSEYMWRLDIKKYSYKQYYLEM